MTKPLTETVAAEVRAELARHNVPRAEVADICGISRTLVWSRLRGDTPFKLAELEKLAERCGVPVSRFLGEEVRAA